MDLLTASNFEMTSNLNSTLDFFMNLCIAYIRSKTYKKETEYSVDFFYIINHLQKLNYVRIQLVYK